MHTFPLSFRTVFLMKSRNDQSLINTELGIFAHPLRPRTGVLASAHPKLRMRGSNPGPSVSRANAQPLDD